MQSNQKIHQVTKNRILIWACSFQGKVPAMHHLGIIVDKSFTGMIKELSSSNSSQGHLVIFLCCLDKPKLNCPCLENIKEISFLRYTAVSLHSLHNPNCTKPNTYWMH